MREIQKTAPAIEQVEQVVRKRRQQVEQVVRKRRLLLYNRLNRL